MKDFIILGKAARLSAIRTRQIVNHCAGFGGYTQDAIQHLVRIGMMETISRGEQKLNHRESAIRRRFVPDSFQCLTRQDFACCRRRKFLYVSDEGRVAAKTGNGLPAWG